MKSFCKSLCLFYLFFCPWCLSFALHPTRIHLDKQVVKKERGFLRLKSSTTNTGESSSLLTKREESYLAVDRCYKRILLSAAVDIATNLQASILSNNFRLDLQSFAVFVTFWKLAVAGGVKYASEIYRRSGKVVMSVEDSETVKHIFSAMAGVWRLTAVMVVIGEGIDAIALFGNTRVARLVFVVAAAMGSFLARSISATETKAFESSHQGRKMGLRATRNMAISVGALLLKGALSPLPLFVKEMSRVQQVNVLAGIATPFVTAGLLWNMRRSFIPVMVAATETERTKSEDLSASYASLFEAQRKFFSKVAATFEKEVQFKVLFSLVSLAQHKLQ